MYVVLPRCSFCERVQDISSTAVEQGRWMPLKTYQLMYGLLPEEIWSTHTDCPDCGPEFAHLMDRNYFESVPSLPA